MIALVAAIPPPPFSAFHIGPLTIRMYGVMIGLGVLAGVWLAGRLFEERGIGDIDDAASIAVWGVFAGIIGARFYHVITDFQSFQNGNFIDAFKVWKPGLGIPGGIFFGTLAGIWAARRRGIPMLPALSCAAPAIPLAQAIGRFGNYFNQELYGRPTTLPWGLEVSSAVNTGYPPGTLFHPTFLYESLWNFALCAALVWVFHHRPRLQPGRLFPLYMVGYGVGRLWIESLRIDPANKIGPFRTNIWMSLLLIVGGATWFVMTRDSTARWPHPLRIGGRSASGVDDRGEAEGREATAAGAAAVAAGRGSRAADVDGDVDGAESGRADTKSDAAKTGAEDAAKTGAAKTGAAQPDAARSGAAKTVVGKTDAEKTHAEKTDADKTDAETTDAGDGAGGDDSHGDADRSSGGKSGGDDVVAADAGDVGSENDDEVDGRHDAGKVAGAAPRKRGAAAKRSASSGAARAKRGSRSHGERSRPAGKRAKEPGNEPDAAGASAVVDAEKSASKAAAAAKDTEIDDPATDD